MDDLFITQSEYFKLFSHPVRLKILEILRREDACVCHINAILDLRQSYVSQQLAVLREGGIIEDQKCGWNVYYRVIDRRIYEIMDGVLSIIDPDGTLLRDPLALPADCPCPRCRDGECDEKVAQPETEYSAE
ncbi:MAG: winged helix-turn-helix transcriptional regulator [Anaerolineae bacterium]|nr:winged helix-turn-helix transcriptional regulator [Anaerolineae bacterium]